MNTVVRKTVPHTGYGERDFSHSENMCTETVDFLSNSRPSPVSGSGSGSVATYLVYFSAFSPLLPRLSQSLPVFLVLPKSLPSEIFHCLRNSQRLSPSQLIFSRFPSFNRLRSSWEIELTTLSLRAHCEFRP